MSLQLDGPGRHELRLILNAVFDRDSLTMALAEAPKSRDLEDLVTRSSFDNELFQLIRRAEREGWLDELIELVKQNTSDPAQLDRVLKLMERASDLPASPGFR